VPGDTAGRAAKARAAVRLAEVARVLELLLAGLGGAGLRIARAQAAYTDTETLYLPAEMSAFGARAENFRLYKASVVFLWAQTRFGTFEVSLARPLEHFDDRARASALFHALEGQRLRARLARSLPGAHRDMCELARLADSRLCPPGLGTAAISLSRPEATVAETYTWLSALYRSGVPAPEPLCFEGTLRAFEVERVMASRPRPLGAETRTLRPPSSQALAQGVAGPPAAELDPRSRGVEGAGEHASRAVGEALRVLLRSVIELRRSREPSAKPEGEPAPGQAPEPSARVDGPAAGEEWSYDEWDFRRGGYRPAWCRLREHAAARGESGFVEDVRRRYAPELRRLRRSFEALRAEARRLRRQPDGDDLDLEALVEAGVDARRGLEAGERLFVRRERADRSVAALFMVDMSGSTLGWVNEAERETLVLLCETLEVLGDAYAIYGFSGATRKGCEIYRIKRFADLYDRTVRERIAGVAARDYTRMGAPIRHLTGKLAGVAARTRLLITLSDGKPDDQDGDYRGRYGIEDTRRALIEARGAGLHPFCITIDRRAPEYLPRMYGAGSYVVIDAVAKLPLRVAEVYRRLTA